MQELRISLTVLPVGRRGQDAIQDASDQGKPLWFALQIAAGFKDPEDVSVTDSLWPWVLHVVKTNKVELNAWVGTTALSLTADAKADTFAATLRKAIVETYGTADARKGLDVRLLRPADAGNTEDYQRTNFPARVQYLATMPGELSSRLLATLYVQIAVGDLFKNNGGQWEPKGTPLFIAPKSVNGSAEIALTGPPTSVDGFLSVTGTDGGMPVIAFGPGFELERFTKPQSTIFDLTTYEVPVHLGDRRYVELESLVLDVLDPFAEPDQLRAREIRQSIELVDTVKGTRRVVPQETLDALIEVWRVRALASELAAAFPAALRELARLLVPTSTPVLTIPDRWGAALAAELATRDVLLLAEKLATRIGIAKTDARTTLRRVAERGGFSVIASLVVQAMDEISSGDASLTALRAAWSFGQPANAPELPARRNAVALTALSEVRERRLVPPLFAKLAGGALPNDAGTMLRDAMKACVALEWPTRREPVVVEALMALGLATKDEPLLEFAANLGVEQAAAHVDSAWPVATAARPELPGRGLSLLVGAESQRVVHEDNNGADDQTSPYREVAGVLLLARRGHDDADLKTRDWRLVTGGTAFLGELGRRVFAPGQTPEIKDEEWLQALLPLPLRPVFQQKVSRADLEYHGQPMLAQSALDQAYGAEDYGDPIPGLLPAYSFQSLGNFQTKVEPEAIASRAPALRYGDVYEFRARVIDQAGGLAPDVADPVKPWLVNLKLPLEPKDPTNIVRYLRAVPVGDLNVLPGRGDETKTASWPALPSDVALRVREWWGLKHDGGENLPALLFSDTKLTDTLASYEFRVLPPAIDEHTLIRWAYPAVADANHVTIIPKLKQALTSLLDARAVEESVQLHDPAVTKLGVRVRGAGKDRAIVKVLEKVIELPNIEDEDEPYQRSPIPVRIKAAAFGTAPTATADVTAVEITIPEGSFASLEIFPLVTKADFDARFVAFEDLTDNSTPFVNHVAFRPSVILLEGATAALPEAKALYDVLNLSEQGQEIAVRFDGNASLENLVFVDRYAIERERWVWRNLPIISDKLPDKVPENHPDFEKNERERRRLAASGPPKEVFTGVRDEHPAVAKWELVAALDRGFADRGEIAGRWPRIDAASVTDEGGPGHKVLLAMDNRDAVTAADYLRYGLRVRSRYAGVLTKKERTAVASSGSTRRRIVTGFRGSKLKPPKILAIVPLTATLDADPLQNPIGASPFMVLLDETFFREYGIGERLDLHLVLENLDFHENTSAKLPYRTGPLPDHWLPRKSAGDARYFRGKVVDASEDEAKPIQLDVFGPFGYSLDITPSEALANASAFVAYPPADVGPHWALFARLRRVLDLPSTGQRSDWSDTHALYTLPNVRLLATNTAPAASIDIAGTQATLRNLRLILDPTATPIKDRVDPLENSEAASQYRYFLLVSRVVPGAGQGFDAELPLGLWRLPFKEGYQKPDTFDVEYRSGAQIKVEPMLLDDGSAPLLASGGEYRGRVLEVMLNGRYEKLARLDKIAKFRAFWESLLANEATDEQDAAGMIRRVSHAFPVRVF